MAADGSAAPAYRTAWPMVLGLIGLDYFSTLAYQPSIAAAGAGLLAPLATAFVVLITLLVSFPIYAYIAGQAPPGQGSLAMLERHVEGWRGKMLILILLGFAATNFVFTRTLSTADASVHVLQHPNERWQNTLDDWAAAGARLQPVSGNPIWQGFWGFWNRQVVTTILLLGVNVLMWPIIWYGFTRRLVQFSLVLVAVYLVLTALILGSGLLYLAHHGELLDAWWAGVRAGDWNISRPGWAGTNSWSLVGMCLWLLPKLALGLSGFELSLVVMPVIRGAGPAQVRATRRFLFTSAAIMGALLLGSALVTTLLMAPASLAPGGHAHERALAFLAHGGELAPGISARDVNPLFGPAFGTIYDLATILVLCLAGASVMIGLKNLLPQFLLRFGMELRWAYAVGFIFHVFTIINLGVTMVFRASVENQRSAYAMSVLVLMASAAGAVALDLARSEAWSRKALAAGPAAACVLFFVTALAIMAGHPGSLVIAGLFVVTIISTSVLSRMARAREFRFEGFEFDGDASRALWDRVRHLEYSVLVPVRPGGRSDREQKEAGIRKRHRVTDDMPLIYVEVEIGDPSDFMQRPLMAIQQERINYVIRITRCVSIAHVIVAMALEFSKVGEPPEVHFGWSDQSPLAANIRFLLFGEGNIPYLVNDLLRRHEPDQSKRPRVIIG